MFLVDTFNLVEGIFWLLLAVLVLRTRYGVLGQYTYWRLYTVVVLFGFGVSDFVQILYGSFLLPGMGWLLWWKLLGVMGLIVSCTWYIWLRIAK